MDKVVLALAKKYTDDTVIGGGGLKGKNCTIYSITEIPGGHRVTFEWTLDDETTRQQTMDVMDGVDGQNGVDGSKGDRGPEGPQGPAGKGIKSAIVNEQEHLIIVYDDSTTQDAGKITVQKNDEAKDISYDNTTSGMIATDVQEAIDEVFQSVSDGKELIADAITDKGVPTSATDTFITMATNISNIQSGEAELAFNINNSTSSVADEEYSHTVVSNGKLYLGLMSYIYQREAKLYKNDVEVTPTTSINTVPTSNQQKLYSKTYNGITVEAGDSLKVTWPSASNHSKHLLAFGVII